MKLRELPNYELFKLVAAAAGILALLIALLSENLPTEVKIGVMVVLAVVILYILYKANRYNIPPFGLIPIEFKITLNYTGIKHGSPKLKGSDYEEGKCLNKLNDNLQFMGVHGGKWIGYNKDEDELEEKMKETIRQAQNNNDKIRFLIVNPDNKHYQFNNPSDDNYKYCYDLYAGLSNAYESFDVRLYDKLPNFRITALNREEVYISRYFFDGESYNYEDQPVVELDREPQWNFVDSYLKYFELQWEADDSVPINECELDSFDIDPIVPDNASS